jgi:hypothetical protein
VEWLLALREQAHFELLGRAADEVAAGRPHIAASETWLAHAALRGEIDGGQTIQSLMKELM